MKVECNDDNVVWVHLRKVNIQNFDFVEIILDDVVGVHMKLYSKIVD